MADDALLPCPVPWCESEVIEVVYSPWSRGYYAACQSCRCQGPSLATHSEAIAAWNRRASHTAAAERIAGLVEENARLREALIDVGEVLASAAKPAKKDPNKHFTDSVKALGEMGGYGALMVTASALWRETLEAQGLAGGEFAAGPCVSTADSVAVAVRAALQEMNDDT